MTNQPGSRLIVVTAVAGDPNDDTCCRDFGTVIECDEVIDVWECPFCGTRWLATCPAAKEARA